jgi:hypothetical protein
VPADNTGRSTAPRDTLEARVRGKLRAGLTPEELQALQSRLPGIMPPEIIELLEYASGFETKGLDPVDFTGHANTFNVPQLVPYGMAIAASIEGNLWIQDVSRIGKWGGVFYVCHDPPIFGVHFDSLEDFLAVATDGDALIESASRLTDAIWARRPEGVGLEPVRRSPDPELARFAQSLPADFRLFDLRAASEARGFVFPDPVSDTIRRADDLLVFGIRKGTESKGWVRRVFGT